MNEPGGLDDLGAAGRAAWTGRVEECVAEVLSDLALDSPHRFVLAATDARTRHRTAVDWPGLPLRPVECLTRHQALALLDWTPSEGEGRIRLISNTFLTISLQVLSTVRVRWHLSTPSGPEIPPTFFPLRPFMVLSDARGWPRTEAGLRS